MQLYIDNVRDAINKIVNENLEDASARLADTLRFAFIGYRDYGYIDQF